MCEIPLKKVRSETGESDSSTDAKKGGKTLKEIGQFLLKISPVAPVVRTPSPTENLSGQPPIQTEPIPLPDTLESLPNSDENKDSENASEKSDKMEEAVKETQETKAPDASSGKVDDGKQEIVLDPEVIIVEPKKEIICLDSDDEGEGDSKNKKNELN